MTQRVGGERSQVQAQAQPGTQDGSAKQSGGVQVLNAVLARGAPTVDAVLGVFHQYPRDRMALVEQVHKFLGNNFLQQVIRAEGGTKDSAMTAEVDRQLAIARKQERGKAPDLPQDRSYAQKKHKNAPWGVTENATIYQNRISKAQGQFSNASAALDDLDRLLRDELTGPAYQLDAAEIQAYIERFHQGRDYVEAKQTFDAAVAELNDAMKKEATLDKDFEDGVGGVDGKQVIGNYTMLALSSLDGAAQASAFVNLHTIQNAKHEVTGVTAPYASVFAEMQELQRVIVASVTREAQARLRSAMRPGDSTYQQLCNAYNALNEQVLRPIKQLNEAREIVEFKEKLGLAIEHDKARMGMGKGEEAEKVIAEIAGLEKEAGEVAPVTATLKRQVVAWFEVAKSGIGISGDVGSVLKGATETLAKVRELDALLGERPSPEAVDKIAELKSAAGIAGAKTSHLVYLLRGLAVAADGYAFAGAVDELRKDHGDPFRYTAVVGNFIATLGDAMMLCPPIAEFGAAFAILGQSIAGASEFCAAVWQSFRPTKIERDRKEILRDIAPDQEHRNEVISSERADSNLETMARVGLTKAEREEVIDNCGNAVDAEGVIGLFVYTQAVLEGSGIGIVSTDQTWKMMKLTGTRSKKVFIMDAARHFGGSVKDLVPYVTQTGTQDWDKMIIRHWLGPRYLQEVPPEGFEDGGIYGPDKYQVIGTGQFGTKKRS